MLFLGLGRDHEPFKHRCPCSLWTFTARLPPPVHKAKSCHVGAVREHRENSSSAPLQEALGLRVRSLSEEGHA